MTIPNGKLIPVGGSEARSPQDEAETRARQATDYFRDGVLSEVLVEMGGPTARIVVVPAASAIPNEMGQMYQEAFGRLGCRQVDVMQLNEPEQANHPDYLRLIEQADGVFFTGGDQSRLVEKLNGSLLLKRLANRYQQDYLVVAGTSAGAAAMARCMIQEGNSEESLLKGMVELSEGMGLLPAAIIDTHFAQRGRLPRLTDALLQQPDMIGLGLSEDTGVVITSGNLLRAIGSGSVFILDTKQIHQSDYESRQNQEPVSISNLKLHILARGTRYRLDIRQFFSPPYPELVKHSL